MTDFVQAWLEQNQFELSHLPEIYDKLYFEGDRALRKLTNYVVLLLLATVISTYGVTSSSSATVIGAMLVAPLMTPIMALTLALVSGQERRAARSLAITAVSVAAVILLAALLSWPAALIDFDTNSEIASRISPGLSALAVALAAGAAGAFATSRKSIGDSLPGVAIAISLVPPLSVVGIAISHGEVIDALGAFLLFFTNFLAIILAGSVVFWLSGANVLDLTAEQEAKRKRAYRVAVISSLGVALLLAMTSFQAYQNSVSYLRTQTAVSEWLADSDQTLVSLTVRYPEVALSVTGSGELAPVESLAAALEGQFGRAPEILVTRLLSERSRYPDLEP